MTWGDLHPPTPNPLPIYPHPNLFPPLLESFKMLVEALASSEYCSFFFFLCLKWFFSSPQHVINNVEVIIHITSPTAYFLMSVCVRVCVCCSTKGCMTVKGWSRCFLKVVSSPTPSFPVPLRTSVTPEMLFNSFTISLPLVCFSSCIIVSLSFYLLNVSCCLFSAL